MASMKKLLMLAVAVCLALGTAVLAQDNMGKSCDTGKSKASSMGPLMTLKGTVKADGDKVTFVNDADQKSWDIMNPEAVKGHEGHHVQLKAHVMADKNTIHVMSLKMLGKGSEKSSM
jgi:hypothetical protein